MTYLMLWLFPSVVVTAFALWATFPESDEFKLFDIFWILVSLALGPISACILIAGMYEDAHKYERLETLTKIKLNPVLWRRK